MFVVLMTSLPVYDDKTAMINKLRTAACKSAFYALEFARNVDKGTHPETLEAVLESPYYSKEYAEDVVPLGSVLDR